MRKIAVSSPYVLIVLWDLKSWIMGDDIFI